MIAVVTVTYNPNFEVFKSNLLTYKDQADQVIIVDNSTKLIIQQSIASLVNTYTNIYVITLGDNYGIGRAQNEGFTYGLKEGYEYFVEMDQDSRLEAGYIDKAYQAFIHCSLNTRIVAMTGIPISQRTNKAYERFKSDSGFIKVQQAQSSGMFISGEGLRTVGLKNEEMFIDMVDWEWCWRAQKMGFEILVNTTLKMYHSLGERDFRLGILRFHSPEPIRHYYAFRNSIYLIRIKAAPKSWGVMTLLTLLIKLLVYPLFFDHGIKRFKLMCLGLRHAFTNQLGRIK